MFYCEGKACNKRSKCIWHNIEKHPDISKHNVIQYIDRSLTGSGGASSNGECWTTWDCGDNGNYALFEPITQDNTTDKDLLNGKLKEWGMSLYNEDGSENSVYRILYNIMNEIDIKELRFSYDLSKIKGHSNYT